MATKTITIDLDAYRRLKKVRKPNESFSRTIKRTVRPPIDLEAWLKRLEEESLSREAIRAIDRQVAARRRNARRRR